MVEIQDFRGKYRKALDKMSHGRLLKRWSFFVPRNDAGIPVDQLEPFATKILRKSAAKKAVIATGLATALAVPTASMTDTVAAFSEGVLNVHVPYLDVLAGSETALACVLGIGVLASIGAYAINYIGTNREARRIAQLDTEGKSSLMQQYVRQNDFTKIDWGITFGMLGLSVAMNLLPVPVVAQIFSISTAVTSTAVWSLLKNAAHLGGGHLLNQEARAVRKDAKRKRKVEQQRLKQIAERNKK